MIYTDKVHLVADSLEELHAFAELIGLKRHFFEGVRKKHPHYDLVYSSLSAVCDNEGIPFTEKVIKHGAKVVSKKEILRISKGLVKQKTLF